ncbi:hypothetical protein RQP46_003233 [Phenoliferia psychrophenolica]
MLASLLVPQSLPSLSDLARFAPRRFYKVPDRSSSPAQRKAYADLWLATSSTIDGAFSKSQLVALCGKGSAEEPGLRINLEDPMLVHQMRGKAGKKWKPKAMNKLGKGDLVRLVLIKMFEMADPKLLPSPKAGASFIQSVPVSEKEAYLLSSEAHPIRRNIIDRLGILLELERSSTNDQLSLVLEGNQQAVLAAVGELEDVVALAHQREFEVPAPAASLPLALYSRISRMSRAYIEPGSEPNVVAAFAVEESSLSLVESLLARAFIHTSIQSSTPLFFAIPTALENTLYTSTPFERMEGKWTFDKALGWLKAHSPTRLFLPSPPARFLAATTTFPPPPALGVMWSNPTPLSPSSPPFDEPTPPAPTTKSTLDAQPTLESRFLRRVVYRPIAVGAPGAPIESIELEMEFGDELDEEVEDPVEVSRVLRKVRSMKVDLAVPEGSCDVQVALTQREILDLSSFPLLSNFLPTPPLSITHSSQTYILDTDRSIRRTLVLPPTSPTLGTSPIPFVQERWLDRLEDGSRGVDVETPLGTGPAGKMESLWKEGAGEVLRTCKVPYPRGEEGLVFKAGR